MSNKLDHHESQVTSHKPPLIALVGNPNTGKSALFNAITGSNQKVANYPGVTVEKKEGAGLFANGNHFNLVDLPGIYSLDAQSPDEEVSQRVLEGTQEGTAKLDAIVCVVDATSLRRSLALALELREYGLPLVIALNMMDLAKRRGIVIDIEGLSKELGMPLIPTVARSEQGIENLLEKLQRELISHAVNDTAIHHHPSMQGIVSRFNQVDALIARHVKDADADDPLTRKIDRVVLHPIGGFLVLLACLALVFQSVFSFAQLPMDLLDSGVTMLASAVSRWLPDGYLQSFIVNGVISGVGSVIIFLPQILLLFFFIILLEDSGYMARAAFLMDNLMGRIGLNGRAVIPLISSYACAIPGIMATRSIENKNDRLITILIAPLTTCSARLPVYALLIAAFIPARNVFGPLSLQGLTLLGLYLLGLVSALVAAFIFKKTLLKKTTSTFLLELPSYKWPTLKNLSLGLLQRAKAFLKRAGTLILLISILLWGLSTFPKAPEGATQPAINYSLAGKFGHWLEPVFKPIGFDWRITTGLVPGFAAREVMVSALATVFAVDENSEDNSKLSVILSNQWTLATALSLLVWYVFAPQCMATLAVVRRETNSWRWPLFMLVYMTLLAYTMSFLTFRIVSWTLNA